MTSSFGKASCLVEERQLVFLELAKVIFERVQSDEAVALTAIAGRAATNL